MRLKDYLVEARLAPLYHATDLDKFQDIIDSGFILPMTYHHADKLLMNKNEKEARWEGSIKGISLTRSLAAAKHWRTKGVAIELDQQQLARRFKIVPIQYWSGITRNSDPYGTRNEYEEFVVTNKGIPLNDVFVKRLYISKTAEEYHKTELVSAKVDLDIGGSEHDQNWYDNVKKNVDALEKLKLDKRVVFY